MHQSRRRRYPAGFSLSQLATSSNKAPLTTKLAARTQAAAEAAPAPVSAPPVPTQENKEAAGAAAGGVAAIGKFLQSKQGKAIEKEVVRGIFGMLKKKF